MVKVTNMTRILMPVPRGCVSMELGSDVRNESWINRQLYGLAKFIWDKGCRPTWLRSYTSRTEELHRTQRKSSPSSKWRTPSQLDVTAVLRELTRVNTGFEWIPTCQKAFQELNYGISENALLVPYVPHLDTRLYVDHGPMGIPLTLAQKHTDKTRKKHVISSVKLTRGNFSEILVLGENFCGKITVFSEPGNA